MAKSILINLMKKILNLCLKNEEFMVMLDIDDKNINDI
jgi:hypothetical protein